MHSVYYCVIDMTVFAIEVVEHMAFRRYSVSGDFLRQTKNIDRGIQALRRVLNLNELSGMMNTENFEFMSLKSKTLVDLINSGSSAEEFFKSRPGYDWLK